jgi:N-acetylglucosaminyl-diphospho-decaprenol L-rhamnosyltransferase
VRPWLEVLIVSYGSAPELEACFRSIDEVLGPVPVAVREHGADPANMEALHGLAAARTGPTRVEHDPTNPGFGAGCNALAWASGAAHVLFLNPDAELVSWPWTASSPPPAVTIVGPRMIESGNPARHWGLGYRVRDEASRSWLRRYSPPPSGTGFVSGAALLVDLDSFRGIGGFDERYFLFYEDIDLCLRANAVGVPTVVDHRWTVRHAGAHSTTQRFGRSLQWSYESALRFHGERGGPLTGYRAYVLADSLARGAWWTARRHRANAVAYLRLGRRAAAELISARWRRSRL